MKVSPFILDSRPSYLEGAPPPTSLLLLPLGESTLLAHVAARVRERFRDPPAVVPLFAHDTAYEKAVHTACPGVETILPAADLRTCLAALEPSDWVLLVDPRWLPVQGLDMELLSEGVDDVRCARHLVALDTSVDGTKECVHLDEEGRVRRIQRYYDSVTWPFTLAVSSSLFPVASTILLPEIQVSSLARLREALASRGVSSHDVAIQGGVFDLTQAPDFLEFSESRMLAHLVASSELERRAGNGASWAQVSRSARVDTTARLVGLVAVQEGAAIESGATVIGPSVIGPGARVESGALVAHSVLAARAVASSGAIVRQRILAEGQSTDAAGPVCARTPSAALRSAARATAALGEALRATGRRRGLYERWKCLIDAVVASMGLLALAPLLLLVALAVKLGSRGPLLYGDRREGLGGREFRCWKFRTMVPDAHALQRALYQRNIMDGPQFKLDDDPRITKVGKFLRRTNLDELPQLLNVVAGQMSLIGPRPSPFRENQICVPWRRARLSVRPGITGLWQVCRHDRAAGDFHQWIYYDTLYVRNMSFWLDVKILIATLVTLGGRYSVPLSWMLPASSLEEPLAVAGAGSARRRASGEAPAARAPVGEVAR